VSIPLDEPLTGTLRMDADGPLLACHFPRSGPIVFIELLRSAPPDAMPDHDAPQRAFTFLRFEIGKEDGDSLTITQGFWPVSSSNSSLCIISAN
jgi:hypothetical protein